MLPPVLERLPVEAVPLLLRAGRQLPEPRAEPAAPGEPRVHRREDARGGRRPRRRVRRRRRPLLLRRRHGRVRPRRLRDRAPRRGVLAKEPGAKIIYDVRASWAVPETIERAGGVAARQPGRPRVHQGADARGRRRLRRRGLGPLLLPRVLAGGHRRRPVPACMLAARFRRAASKLSELLRPFRERYFITGELNTPVADVAGEAPRAGGALRARGRRSSTSTALSVDGRRLALQRPAVEHRAAPPPQPRGALRRS